MSPERFVKRVLIYVSICFCLFSCASKDELNEILGRIDAIENTQIASINAQISSISNSIGEMKTIENGLKDYIDNLKESRTQLDASLTSIRSKIEVVRNELNNEVTDSRLETLEALENLESNLENQISLVDKMLVILQQENSGLAGRIEALEMYVTQDLKKSNDWVGSSLTTLEQYNKTTESIEGIKIDIEAINKSIASLEAALNAKIDDGIAEALKTLRSEIKDESDKQTQAIASLENNLKTWVNSQLANYYTIAELDAKFEQLKNQYGDADKALKAEIDDILASIEKQKQDITDAYKKAIADAIEKNNGEISKTIQNEIKAVNDRITSVASDINTRLTNIESRLSGVEQQVSEILSMIQSVIVVPTYSNGSVGISDGDCELRFEILPLYVAEKLPTIDLSAFSLKVVSTVQTKAGDGGGVLLPVKEVSYKDEEVIIKTSGESLPKEFFRGMEGASCRLKITDGINNVSSSFFSLTPDNTAGGFFFKIQDLKGNYYEPFLVEDNIIHVSIPKGVNLSALYPIFMGQDIFMSSLGFEITGKQAFDFSDFTKPFTFRQITKEGEETKWMVNIYDLPVLVMETPERQPIVSKDTRVEGTVLKIVEGNNITSLGTAGVRGRGNSTWEQPKKPYNVKFDKKVSVLGMKKSKQWVLVSNAYYDRTQLHNYVSHEMAKMMDFSWVPDNRYVELILNGEHKGLYQFNEKIKVEKDRIGITELEDIDNWNSGYDFGYLLEETMTPYETENAFETNYFNRTGYNCNFKLGWEIKSPDGDGLLPTTLVDFIKSDLNNIEALIYDDDKLLTGKYREAYDIESAIDWLLLELAVNNDEMARSKNVFMYKENGNGKLKIGPPWDFDFATFESNDPVNYTFDYFVNTALYYRQLRKDEVFRERMKEKWAQYKSIWETRVPLIIESQCDIIKNSAKRNELMWPNWQFSSGSYDEHIESMKSSFIRNLNYMDSKILTITDYQGYGF